MIVACRSERSVGSRLPVERSLGWSLNRTDSHAVVGKTVVMLRIGTTVMGVEDLERATTFWCAALGYRLKREIRSDDDFMILVPNDDEGVEGPHLAFDVVDSIAPKFPRVHLDLYAGDAADQHAEIERLISLGAQRVDWPHYESDSDFVVLADPEGNRFCVIDTSADTSLHPA